MDNLKNIFLVIYCQGEHDDYETWPVAAFRSYENAESYAVLVREDAENLIAQNSNAPWNAAPESYKSFWNIDAVFLHSTPKTWVMKILLT